MPATIALAWVARRRAPVLTAVGGTIALLGFLAVLGQGPDDITLARITAAEHLDVGTIAALDDAWWALPLPSISVLLFLLGLVVGLPLLGIGLWRGRVTPRWTAAALIAGTATHPFVPGHVAGGIGLLVAAVGFVGVGRALLQTRDDDFDLPPVSRVDTA